MKKKLLFVNGHLNTGGVEKSLIDLLRHMDYSRYEVTLLLLEGTGDYAELLPPDVHVVLWDLHNTYGSFFRAIMRCLRKRDWLGLCMRILFGAEKVFGKKALLPAQSMLLGNNTYDIAIGYRTGICSDIVAYSAKASKRISWWHHGEFRLNVKGYEEMASRCDRIVAVSESCAKLIRDIVPALDKKICVIPNMVDTALVASMAGMGDEYIDESYSIVTISRLSEEKHVENVLITANKLLNSGFPIKWHVFGDGDLMPELQEKARTLGLEETVIFEGSKANPYPFLKSADLYVHPSYVESQGLTVLEAMSLGVPCVVTKSRGPCEYVRDGENGLLVDQSPDALAEGVERMLRDTVLYQHIKNNTRCPEEFLPEAVKRKVESIL